jgi:hypothetical protein
MLGEQLGLIELISHRNIYGGEEDLQRELKDGPLLHGAPVPLGLGSGGRLLAQPQLLHLLLEELLQPDGALVLLGILHIVLNR